MIVVLVRATPEGEASRGMLLVQAVQYAPAIWVVKRISTIYCGGILGRTQYSRLSLTPADSS
jgi:hypothetical protein